MQDERSRHECRRSLKATAQEHGMSAHSMLLERSLSRRLPPPRGDAKRRRPIKVDRFPLCRLCRHTSRRARCRIITVISHQLLYFFQDFTHQVWLEAQYTAVSAVSRSGLRPFRSLQAVIIICRMNHSLDNAFR